MNKIFGSATLLFIFFSSFSERVEDNVEFLCFRKQVATNTCHFNFKINGAPYRFVDNGCRFEKKREVIIERARRGNLSLAKDWKFPCNDASDKSKAHPKPEEGF